MSLGVPWGVLHLNLHEILLGREADLVYIKSVSSRFSWFAALPCRRLSPTYGLQIMQIRCPGCVQRNYLQLWYSFISLETKIRSPNWPWKIICSDFGLTAQQRFPGPYLLAPLSELSIPHVQIEGIVEAHNFGSQTFTIKGHLSLWIVPKDHVVLGCENISRAELISLVNIQIPGVLHVDASVLGLFGVLFTSCLDLWRDSWSSLEVLDELIPKVCSLTLISCVNNKLKNRHASVNLLHHQYA
jgi:hypothetical protein